MLAELILNLDRSRFRPCLVVLKQPGKTAEGLMEKGIPVFTLGLPNKVSARYFLLLPGAFVRLIRLIHRAKPVIIHSFLFQANILGRFAATIYRVPVNISSLRVMEMEHASHAPIDRLSSFLVTRYSAVCQAVKDHAVRLLDIPREKICTIYNGIDPRSYEDQDGSSLRRQLGIENSRKVIGAVGRLCRQKGMDVLIRALPELVHAFPGLKCIITGDGPQRKILEALAEGLELGDSVVFVGERSDIPQIMAALDVFVLPSRWEGMPNAVMEAMAAARPVIATAVGGCPELIEPGRNGILVPPEDHKALAQAITKILQDSHRAREMGKAGRQKISQTFTINTMVRENQDMYKSLLQNAGINME